MFFPAIASVWSNWAPHNVKEAKRNLSTFADEGLFDCIWSRHFHKQFPQWTLPSPCRGSTEFRLISDQEVNIVYFKIVECGYLHLPQWHVKKGAVAINCLFSQFMPQTYQICATVSNTHPSQSKVESSNSNWQCRINKTENLLMKSMVGDKEFGFSTILLNHGHLRLTANVQTFMPQIPASRAYILKWRRATLSRLGCQTPMSQVPMAKAL